MARIGVIGAGAFGTALACVIRRSGHDVVLWAREPDVVEWINRDRMNPIFLRGVPLIPGIVATTDLAAAAEDAEFLLLAPPAQHVRGVTNRLRPFFKPGTPVVTCSKGIERGTCALMSQVITETLPGALIAVLSGPSFANEIAIDLPTGVTLACRDLILGERLAAAIGTPRFRTYLSDDAVGTHIGGVLKNVLAIACGIALGEGRKLRDVLGERVTVQEGVHSAESVAALARRDDVDMPITLAVDQVLNHGADVDQTIAQLLAHPYRFEFSGKA